MKTHIVDCDFLTKAIYYTVLKNNQMGHENITALCFHFFIFNTYNNGNISLYSGAENVHF